MRNAMIIRDFVPYIKSKYIAVNSLFFTRKDIDKSVLELVVNLYILPVHHLRGFSSTHLYTLYKDQKFDLVNHYQMSPFEISLVESKLLWLVKNDKYAFNCTFMQDFPLIDFISQVKSHMLSKITFPTNDPFVKRILKSRIDILNGILHSGPKSIQNKDFRRYRNDKEVLLKKLCTDPMFFQYYDHVGTYHVLGKIRPVYRVQENVLIAGTKYYKKEDQPWKNKLKMKSIASRPIYSNNALVLNIPGSLVADLYVRYRAIKTLRNNRSFVLGVERRRHDLWKPDGVFCRKGWEQMQK